MTEHRTPDELNTENELICTKLLGWGKCEHIAHISGLFHTPAGKHEEVPSFTTWADAGLVLEAWTAANNDYDIEGTSTEHGLKISARLRQIKGISYVSDFVGYGETAPLAVRAAAIKYIRSLP